MEKNLIGISIIREPYFHYFYENEMLNLAGLLIGYYTEDKKNGLVLFPYIECPKIKGPGEYELKIYESKEKKFKVSWFFNVYAAKE